MFMIIVMHAAEGTFAMLAGAVFAGAALAQLAWVGVAVWFVVAIGLVIFDWRFWCGAAAAKATTPPVIPHRAEPVALA